MKRYNFHHPLVERDYLPGRVVVVAVAVGIRDNRLMIALWVSAATVGGGAAGRPCVGGNAPIEFALSRRRVPAAVGHVATRQRQETRQLSRHSQPRAHAGSEDTLQWFTRIRSSPGRS